jgi:DNA-binding response OmpR family regulator
MDDNIRILIVDDEPDILFATSRIIEKAGYQVERAASGRECMEKVRRERPDLLFLDVVLPDADGAEICRQIKADPDLRSVFVVLISGHKVDTEEQAEGLECGADTYIARPISNRELRARLRAIVRILEAERERDRVILELKEALAEVKKLSGLLPICSYCKRIRDDQGYWNQLEAFIQKHSSAEFSHSICKACADKYLAEWNLYKD